MRKKKTVVLCILDGWGISADKKFDATAISVTPNFDKIMSESPNAKLITHGESVGLPSGQVGNSEVGHMNIGAGRIVSMDLPRIDLALKDRTFFKKLEFKKFCTHLMQTQGVAHIMGLISPGGVHSNYEQILKVANHIANISIRVNIHLVLDGRDVPPKSALKYLAYFMEKLDGRIKVSTLCGRFYAMDRDNRWDRTELAHRNVLEADGPRFPTVDQALEFYYNLNISDEFITPSVLSDYTGISSNSDAFLFMNFRADRARQICSSLGDPNFDKFYVDRKKTFSKICGLVEYSNMHNSFMGAIFEKKLVNNTLGQWLSLHGKLQFRLAETEKYAHVTYFLNGGEEKEMVGESRCLVASPKVKTYDLCPQMAANKVTEQLLKAISSNKFDLIVVNYANPDMVGHTGKLDAAIEACNAVDNELGKVLGIISEKKVKMLLIADHGNCETMVDIETGEPHTSHTLNPVPVSLVGSEKAIKLRKGILADVAPTILDMLNMEKPVEMTGISLIVH